MELTSRPDSDKFQFVTVDRRDARRFACDIEARVELGGGHSFPARTVDVSYSGICVVAEESVPFGAQVTFHVRLVFEQAESDSLAIPGKIVWSTPIEGQHQLGGRFDKNMDSRSWARLDVLLQFLSGELDLNS